VPELAVLLQEGEDINTFLKLPPETILMRWVNFHLLASSSEARPITNFGSDLTSGEVYVRLLNRLDPYKCPLTLLDAASPDERAEAVLVAARSMGIPIIIREQDIVAGSKHLNLAFCSQIFNTNHGLDLKGAVSKVEELPEISDATREERMYRAWMSSMDLGDGLVVNDVYGDIANTPVLLKVIDNVRPGTVDWRRVNITKLNSFKLIENLNYAITLARDVLKVKINFIGGADIYDQKKSLVLAILWQLLRMQTVAMIQSVAGSKDIADSDILKWANTTLEAAGKPGRFPSFKDPSLGSGVLLLDLLHALSPKAVNPDLVNPGDTPEGKELNAKYVISVARKIGASIYCTWDDISDVKPKMILLLVAATMQVAQRTGSRK